MKVTRSDVHAELLRGGGVLSYRSPPELYSLIRRMARQGELASVLPGIFASSSNADDPLIRMRAARLRDPDVVFTGLSAARLLWGIPYGGPVTLTGRTWSHRPGFRFGDIAIDPDWVVELDGLRCMAAPLTAVDLIPDHGGQYVDHLLRISHGRGSATLRSMWAALEAHPNRPGNTLRRHVLVESRDEPWSEAERLVHQQLRSARIRGWSANYAVECSSGRCYFLDVAFPDLKLALEVDGYRTHSTPEAFERDRERQNDLVVDDWLVLRVTWAMAQDARWLAWVRRALSTSSRRFSSCG